MQQTQLTKDYQPIKQNPESRFIKPHKNQSPAEKLMLSHGNIVSGILTGIGIIGLITGGIMFYSAHTNHVQTVNQFNANNVKIAKLKTEYKILQNSSSVNPKEGREELTSATKQGDKLAQYQNEFANAGTNQKHLHKLSQKILPLLTSDDNGVTPWYYTGHPNDQGNWQFASRYAFDQKQIKVLFTCKNKKGDLLAYTTGKYDVKKKEFADLKTTVTAEGNRLTKKSGGATKAQQKQQLNKSIESIQKATKGEHFNKITPKEAEAIEKHRQEMYEQAKKEGKVKY